MKVNNLKKQGICFGLNLDTNEEIYYDVNTNTYVNHEIILGTHGSGKSYLCKEEIKDIYES